MEARTQPLVVHPVMIVVSTRWVVRNVTSGVRKKIDGADEPSLIQTVRGAGYRLAAPGPAASGSSGRP